MAKAFERIVIVMLENATRGTVTRNSYMNLLRRKGVFLKNSFGVTHPSQPNYIALIGGDTLGFANDNPGWVQWIYTNEPPPVTSIVDLLERRGVTWKAYAEDLLPSDIVSPDIPDPPAGHGNFARKHVPFLSFPNIVSKPERAKCFVPALQFPNDFGHDLPQYAFYTPNLIHDGHSLPSGQKADPTDGRNIDNIAAFLHEFLSDDPIANFHPRR
jgi:acid phosphatase